MSSDFLLLAYVIFGIIAIPLILIARIFIHKRFNKRPVKRQVVGNEMVNEISLPADKISKVELLWSDMFNHDKADEYLKIHGVFNENVNFYIIACIGAFKSLCILQISAGNKLLTPLEGSKGLVELKGSDSAIISYSLDHGITVDFHRQRKDITEIFAGEGKAFICVENIMSFVKGNCIGFHFKELEPELQFIKHWDMPTSYASFAAFSDSSAIASGMQRVVSAGEFKQNNDSSTSFVQLSKGAVYVIGSDCTDTLQFLCDGSLALRLVVNDEVDSGNENELSSVFDAVMGHPLVHLKIRLDESNEPVVYFRKIDDDKDRSFSLLRCNMVGTITTDDEHEIFRIEAVNQGLKDSILKVSLNGSRKNYCPYLAIWKY